jgi:hypothetical protein
VINKDERIICVDTAKGTTHDFKLFKQSRLPLKANSCVFVDLSHLGIAKIDANCATPHKASKLHPLNNEQREDNRQKTSARICVEHVNAKIKTFQILTQKYRNRRKRFNLRFNLICGLINFERDFRVA